MRSILSTKKLKPNQRDLLLGQGFTLVDYNAITIAFLDFDMPNKIENAIFTSQNGVLSFINKFDARSSAVENCFCVGQKTKLLLEENGLKVTKVAINASELGDYLAINYKNDSFHYFCGSERRDELPNKLKTSKIDFFEIKTYKTTLKPKKFDQKWDGILFFSTSGVESYFETNKDKVKVIPQQVRNDQQILFCIGETTANAARKYSANVIVSNDTLVESVIAKTVKTLKNR